MGKASRTKAQARMLREELGANGRPLCLADLLRPDWVRGLLSDEGWLVFASLWDVQSGALIRPLCPLVFGKWWTWSALGFCLILVGSGLFVFHRR